MIFLEKPKIKLTITGTPSSRKYFDVVLFPVAAPPVSPIRNIAQALIRSRCSTMVSLSLSKYLSSLFVQSKSKSFFLSILTFVVLTQFFNVLESRWDCCLCCFIYWAAELKWKQIGIYPSSMINHDSVGRYLDEVFWLNTYFKYWEIFLYKIIINEGTDLPYFLSLSKDKNMRAFLWRWYLYSITMQYLQPFRFTDVL